MATIKSYTDIEQSKKLAEILPLESADMAYYFWKNSGNIVTPSPFILDETVEKSDGMLTYLNCWSLAALLGILPLEIETHKQTDGYKIYYYVESYMKRMGKEIYLSTERHENLVDACVEMIIRLNELKML